MRDFDLARTFSLVTIPFRAFQHLLTVEDQIACLTCVRRHMSADGRFIVDLFNPSLEMLVNTEVGMEFESDPPFVLHAFSMRNSFKFEMEHLLYRIGFVVEQVYADFDRTPFGSKYPGELIFVSRKA